MGQSYCLALREDPAAQREGPGAIRHEAGRLETERRFLSYGQAASGPHAVRLTREGLNTRGGKREHV